LPIVIDFVESFVNVGIEKGLEQGLEQGREQGIVEGAFGLKPKALSRSSTPVISSRRKTSEARSTPPLISPSSTAGSTGR
jgi:hypothetical protein